MRLLLVLLALCLPAWAHGGSGRATSSAGVPSGGFGGKLPPPPGPNPDGGGESPTTIVSAPRQHDWRVWWAYNREWYLARRLRGVPLSGTRIDADANGKVTRKKLRETVLEPILIDALDDKNHHVREAAAVALGKFGKREFNDRLRRRTDAPREKFLSTRDACIYAMGLLRLPENRAFMTAIAGDKRRPLLTRSVALTSLALDGSADSVATLRWHLEYHRSSLRFTPWTAPTVSEEDRRRFAAHLLGFVGPKHDVDDLLYRAVLGSRRWTEATQGLAATALGRRRARAYKDRLLRLVHRRDAPRALKQSIPIALGMMLNRTDEADIKELGRIAKDFKRRPAVQHFAIMALARIGGPQCVEILIGQLRQNVHVDERERCFVYLALGILGAQSKDACEELMAEFERRVSPSSRAALALALGLARHKPAVAPTLRYLEEAKLGPAPASPSSRAAKGLPSSSGGGVKASGTDVLAYGTLALGLHGRPELAGDVKRILKKYRVARIQAAASIALVLLERNRAIDTLAPMLGDSGNATTRAAIMMGLGLVPSPDRKVVDALRAQYERDSNPDPVRALAIVGLGALGDPGAVPMSVRLVRGYNYLIRCQALDLIARLL